MKILFPDEVVLETKHFKVAQDWEVPIPAFFIVSTLRNIRSVEEFTDEEAREFTPLIKKIRMGMKEVLNIGDVYLFQNEDSTHGFHLWMFPRYEWMEVFGKKIESVRPIMKHATEFFSSEEGFVAVRQNVEQMKRYLEKDSTFS